MRKSGIVFLVLVSLVFLTGCPPQHPPKETRIPKPHPNQENFDERAQEAAKANADRKAKERASAARRPAVRRPVAPKPPAGPKPTTEQADVDALLARLKEFGEALNTCKITPSGALQELNIKTDLLTLEDIQLIAKMSDLQKLTFLDCRTYKDEFTKELLPLKDKLVSLTIGNSNIEEASAITISEFTNLTDLNLERNPSIRDSSCKHIAKLEKLESLKLIYTGITETGLMQIRKLPNLKSLDIRGCTSIANAGMRSVARIKTLTSFQHYSNAVTDYGVESLTELEGVESLFFQDFRLTDAAGESLKKFKNLNSLVLFRCGEFGSRGLKELKGLPLTRLTLRGVSSVGNDGFEVFDDMPKLKRLYLTELEALGDDAFVHLPNLKSLEVLEVEIVPISDEAVKSIAKITSLKELKLRSTEITNECLDDLMKLPNLTSLQLLDNGRIDLPAAQEKLGTKNYKVLNVGVSRGAVQE